MDFDIIANPEKHGYKECPHCHGYGSSFKDPVDVNICTECDGNGVVPKDSD
jgi:DnaJ-class molecular chaperone